MFFCSCWLCTDENSSASRRSGSSTPPPLPPPPLKAVMIIFIFYQKQKVYIQNKKSWLSYGAARSSARRWPIRTHFRHFVMFWNMFPPVKKNNNNIV
jgi:hypothetical protein